MDSIEHYDEFPTERDVRIGELSLSVSMRKWNEDSWRNATYAPVTLHAVTPDDLMNAHDLWHLLVSRNESDLFDKRGVSECLGNAIEPNLTDAEWSKWKAQVAKPFGVETRVVFLRNQLTEQAIQMANKEMISLMSLSGSLKELEVLVEDIVTAGRLVRVMKEWAGKDADERTYEQMKNEELRILLTELAEAYDKDTKDESDEQ